MNVSRNATALSAANSMTSENSVNSSLMRTPVAASGTTVFLREEGSTTFLPVYHQSSVTLRDLAEEFSISSVLECDAQGNVQPRAVAFDSPSDILHSGRHYIARRDARAETGGSYVTFKGKICVKEYELEHPTPPTTRPGKTVAIADGAVGNGAPADASRRRPAATPFADKRRPQEALDSHEAYFAAQEKEGSTPVFQRMANEEEEESTTSRALALSSGRKRPRDDSAAPSDEGAPAYSQQGDKFGESMLSDTQNSAREGGTVVFQSPTKREGGVLHDRTNSSFSSSTSSPKAPATSQLDDSRTGEEPSLQSSAAPAVSQPTAAAPPPKQSLRFIPFTQTAADGTETYVTLESLQQLCNEVSAQEEEFHKKHRAATDILESARRVLFLNDGCE